MKKIILSVFCLAALVSCSSDDDGGSGSEIKSYIVEWKSFNNGETDPYARSKTRYNLKDGKYFSMTEIDAETGQVFGTFETHRYTDGLLTHEGSMFTSTDFTYDNNRNLIATDYWDDSMIEIHWRFVHVSPTVSYAELLTLASADPAAEINRRIIMEFDAENNVTAAGDDADLDGVMDHVNHFSYENNSLTASEEWTGGTLLYPRSDVINNLSVIYDNTYGKKAGRLINAANYAATPIASLPLHSFNLSEYFLTAGDYEVMDSHYYKKSTMVYIFDGGRSEERTTFYFE